MAAAALAGMGVGGGGLLMIWLTLVLHYEIAQARAVNLAFFIVSAGAAMPYHIRQRSIAWRYVILLTVSAIPGVWVGGFLSEWMSGNVVRMLFGVFFVFCGVMVLLRKIKRKKH